MKKFLLVCGLFAMAMVTTFAQETKRVAILETVDKQGNVSYASKLMLRSNLAKAITNTPGYEAYDRTDMDAIMGEQDFQRTGMVSNDQIKRLGEMTGAKYVLVAEAAVVDAHNMYITAKLLDVETARTVMTDNQLMGATAKEIQRGCQLLADKLIRPAIATTASNVKPAKQEKPAPAKQEQPIQAKPTPAPQPTPAPVQYQQPIIYNQPAQTAGMIVKMSNNEYRLNGSTMDRKAYEKFIYQNCPEAWKKHQQANRTIKAGWSFFTMGIALTSMWGLLGANDEYDIGYRSDGSYYYYYTTSYEAKISAVVLGSIGAGFTALSFPLLGAGYHKKHNTYKVYNNYCTSSQRTPMSLNFKADQDGLGFALHF